MSSDRLLAELLNRSRLLEYALAHVETATASGSRPAQRDALKALYHTAQLFALDSAQLRSRAEAAGILAAGNGYNDDWLVIPERQEEAATAPAPAPPEPPGGSEKILVVDPDEGTRALATAMLRELGYRVHETRSGEEALGHLAANPDEVHLLVTTHHLPGMTGSQLAESVTSWHPRARVLYTQADAPLRPSELARKVREALTTAAASGGVFSAA
ncbi:MAG TPA: response regulator [Gemmatimonadales bacterium]